MISQRVNMCNMWLSVWFVLTATTFFLPSFIYESTHTYSHTHKQRCRGPWSQVEYSPNRTFSGAHIVYECVRLCVRLCARCTCSAYTRVCVWRWRFECLSDSELLIRGCQFVCKLRPWRITKRSYSCFCAIFDTGPCCGTHENFVSENQNRSLESVCVLVCIYVCVCVFLSFSL